MKPTIWIFGIEPIETRYTAQWHEHVPKLLENSLDKKFNVIQIDGIQKNSTVTPGAFLNFSDTNYWKSSQLCNFLEYFNQGKISKLDQFLFTDAWNPIIIQLKYMNDLLGYNWKIHGLWHAGSWDPQDFLGRLVGDTPWVRHAEKSLFYSIDHNYFATQFHIDLFSDTLLSKNEKEKYILNKKIIRSGWPMEYISDILTRYKWLPKRDIILFPHRIAPEKQLDIFLDLKKELPQYEFIVCQEKILSKNEYHKLLGQSKMIFSANLQETLGISTCAEGPLVNAIPFAPDRLSYLEIFKNYPEFLYPSTWTINWDSYRFFRELLKKKIIYTMDNYNDLQAIINNYINNDYQKFFTAKELIKNIGEINAL